MEAVITNLMRVKHLQRFLCRLLVALLIAGMLPGPGPDSGTVSADGGYSVTYAANGGDGGTPPVDPVLYDAGDKVLIHGNSNGLTKEGYLFAGWNTLADGSGTDYLPGQIMTMGSQDVTLYAKWVDPMTVWADRSSVAGNFNDVVYYDGAFYAVGKSGLIASSVDGNLWTKQTSLTNRELFGIAGGNGLLVAVGANGTILVSDNGVDWSHRPSGTSNALLGVAYGDGRFMAVGANGTILVSPNGSLWTQVNAGTSTGDELRDVAWGNGKFVAVGVSGSYLPLIVTSSDGENWNIKTALTYFNHNSVTYGNGMFVVVGDFGTVLTSADGDAWTSRTSNSFANMNDIAYGNGMFVAVGTEAPEGRRASPELRFLL